MHLNFLAHPPSLGYNGYIMVCWYIVHLYIWYIWSLGALGTFDTFGTLVHWYIVTIGIFGTTHTFVQGLHPAPLVWWYIGALGTFCTCDRLAHCTFGTFCTWIHWFIGTPPQVVHLAHLVHGYIGTLLELVHLVHSVLLVPLVYLVHLVHWDIGTLVHSTRLVHLYWGRFRSKPKQNSLYIPGNMVQGFCRERVLVRWVRLSLTDQLKAKRFSVRMKMSTL